MFSKPCREHRYIGADTEISSEVNMVKPVIQAQIIDP